MTCGWCGEIATGLASINDKHYCHGDNDAEPTCYERAQWAMSGIRPDLTLLQDEARCTCIMLTAQTPWEPADWEQADNCPVHPLSSVCDEASYELGREDCRQ